MRQSKPEALRRGKQERGAAALVAVLGLALGAGCSGDTSTSMTTAQPNLPSTSSTPGTMIAPAPSASTSGESAMPSGNSTSEGMPPTTLLPTAGTSADTGGTGMGAPPDMPPNAAPGAQHWVGTWTASPYFDMGNQPPASLSNAVLRQIAH